MVFILIAIALIIAGIVLAIVSLKNNLDWGFTPVGAALTLAAILFAGVYLHGERHLNDYTELQCFDNLAEVQKLEELPFEKAPFEMVYVSRSKSPSGNSVYRYCVETENGCVEQNVLHPVIGDVYINYIDKNDEPYLDYQSKRQERVLVKKPSFWWNIVGWYKFKDLSIGDAWVTVDSTYAETYVFYVPEGSLREAS